VLRLVRSDLRERRTGDRHKRHVTTLQNLAKPRIIEGMVGRAGAALAEGLPILEPHEVMDVQLAPTAKQSWEIDRAFRPGEDIRFVDLYHRQTPSCRIHRIAQMGELFFSGEQSLAGRQPNFARNNWGQANAGSVFHMVIV
jgi:hypothetical protein